MNTATIELLAWAVRSRGPDLCIGSRAQAGKELEGWKYRFT